MISKGLIKKLQLNENDLIDIEIEQDNNIYGMPLPDEFAEIFAYDDEAYHFFDALKPGVRRALMHIIIKIKSDSLRAERAIMMIDFLKLNRGVFDFKGFNEYVKMG